MNSTLTKPPPGGFFAPERMAERIDHLDRFAAVQHRGKTGFSALDLSFGQCDRAAMRQRDALRKLRARGKAAGLVEWRPTPEELVDFARRTGACKIGVDTGTGKVAIEYDGEKFQQVMTGFPIRKRPE